MYYAFQIILTCFCLRLLKSNIFRHCNLFSDETTLGNRTTGKNRLWGVFRRRYYLSRLLLHVPHSQLSLSVCREAIFEAGLLRYRSSNHGQLCAMALLRFLLSLQAQGVMNSKLLIATINTVNMIPGNLPLGSLRFGHYQHYGVPVG